MVAENLKVVIEAEVDKAVRDLKQVQQQTDQAQKKGGRSLAKLGLSFAAVAGSVAAVVAVVKKLEAAYAEQERAEAKLAGVLRATGEAAGFNQGELQDMASGLQQVTTFSDDAIIGMQSLLLTFKGIQGEAFERTQGLALDLSAAFGQDLKSSAIQLGKALEDPTAGLTALSRIGVSFTQTQTEMIKSMQEAGDVAGAQAVILDTLEGQVGGVAEAMADTATGASDQLKNSWGDLMESFGEGISRGLRPAREALTGLIDRIVEARGEIARGVELRSGEAIGVTNEELAKIRENIALLTEQRDALKAYREELMTPGARPTTPPPNTGGMNLEQLQEAIDRQQELLDRTAEERRAARNKALEEQIMAETAAAREEARILADRMGRYQDMHNERRMLQSQYASRVAEIAQLEQNELMTTEEAETARDRALEETLSAARELWDAYNDIANEDFGDTITRALPSDNIGLFIAELVRLKSAAEETGEAVEDPLTESVWGMAEAYAAMGQAGINWGNATTLQFERVADAAELTLNDVLTMADGISGVFSSLTQVYANNADSRIDAVQAAAEAEMEAARQAGASEEELDRIKEESVDKQNQILAKQARQEKAAATFSAIINTASAITKALNTQPFLPLGPIMAGIAAAQGAAQIAAIASQPIPTAQLGGSFEVPPGANQDSGLVRVNSGERVDVTPARQSGGGGMPDKIVVRIADRDFVAAVEGVFNKQGGRITKKGAIQTR